MKKTQKTNFTVRNKIYQMRPNQLKGKYYDYSAQNSAINTDSPSYTSSFNVGFCIVT